MIGQEITNKDGFPVVNGRQLNTTSVYQPNAEVLKLWAQIQKDYYVGYTLQHRSFDEFDGMSLLDRMRLDQQTFGAFVGATYLPKHKAWRWRGRKNTARNKIIGILAHLLAAMLFPYVHATNDEDEEDKMTARVMRILIENHLRKAKYEIKYLFIILSALVNPAVFVGVEYVEAMQRVKQRMADGHIKVIEAVDEILSGLNISIIPVDEVLLGDFYSGTGQVQRQPVVLRVRRISFDDARAMYSGKYFDENGKDLFGFVQAGKTRIVAATQENQTLFDIDWTEADPNFVQEITAYYRSEDLEVKIVGGVFLGNTKDVYNSNPFSHRRMSVVGNDWISVPVIPIAMSGFEPMDPSGRFAWYKSAANKEYWDDKSQNAMHRILHDGTYLDVIKPFLISGVAKFDSTVMVPGATVAIPSGAVPTPYSLGPNLAAAMQLMNKEEQDMSESTQDKIMDGIAQAGVTATASIRAEQNARKVLGVFGIMIADLVTQIGELTKDCTIMHTTMGEIDATVPEAPRLKFKAIIARGMDKGRKVTNRIVFSDQMMGNDMTEDEKHTLEWALFDKAGGAETDQRIYMVNPFKFARTMYELWVDADQITDRSMGNDRIKNQVAFNMLTDPRVLPFVDPEAVVNDFVIDEYSDGDPERYKRKAGIPQNNELLNSMMGQGPDAGGGTPTPTPTPSPAGGVPGQLPANALA